MVSISKHPSYADGLEDWILMRDSFKGERQVKLRGITYLPATPAHYEDGFGTQIVNSKGLRDYLSYKRRARYPNFVSEAIEMAIGMMHSQPPRIDLPESMEKITSSRGEDLKTLLRRINFEQLVTGRVGLMADLPVVADQNEIPYITTYTAERIINWDTSEVPEKLVFVVLDESGDVRNGMNWTTEQKFRVLELLGNEYSQGVFTDPQNYDPANLKAPSWRGNTLNQLPFVIINAVDITPELGDVPLLDLANMCMTIYRGDADYRQNLFMQGQDTFVTMGGAFDQDDSVRVGAGARIDLPLGAKAEYVGVTSSGLSEQRQAQENLEKRAGTMGAQTLDSTSRERESGSSLRIRVAARTADMNQIADAGALGLQDILRSVAIWIGEDPNKVNVIPNKEFGEAEIEGQSMVEMQTSRNLGFPISARSLHEYAYKRRLTTRTFEEEIKEAEKETGNHVFAKAKTGDRAELQPNGNNSNGNDSQQE